MFARKARRAGVMRPRALDAEGSVRSQRPRPGFKCPRRRQGLHRRRAVSPSGDGGPETLLHDAGTALHRARWAGKSGAAFFRPEMGHEPRGRRALERDLREAVNVSPQRMQQGEAFAAMAEQALAASGLEPSRPVLEVTKDVLIHDPGRHARIRPRRLTTAAMCGTAMGCSQLHAPTPSAGPPRTASSASGASSAPTTTRAGPGTAGIAVSA